MSDDRIFDFSESAPRFLIRSTVYTAGGQQPWGIPHTVDQCEVLGHLGRCPDFAFGHAIVTNRSLSSGDLLVTILSPHFDDPIAAGPY